MTEMSTPQPHEPDQHEQRLLEVAADQGIHNPFMGRVAAQGAFPQKVSSEQPKLRHQPHYSRRGGRAYPEPTDSELDPYWNATPTVELTDEERDRAHEAAAKVHDIIAELTDKRLVEQAAGDEKELALLRLRERNRRERHRRELGLE